MAINKMVDDDVVPRNWDDSKGALTLNRAYHRWRQENILARTAEHDPAVAHGHNISLVKSLYRYLKSLDFDASVMECRGLKVPLVDPAPALQEAVSELGAIHVQKSLTHGVVKVNQLILDPCYARLGKKYFLKDNYMLVELDQKWQTAVSMNNLVDMDKHAAAALQKKASEAAKLEMQDSLGRSRGGDLGKGIDFVGLNSAGSTRVLRRNRLLRSMIRKIKVPL